MKNKPMEEERLTPENLVYLLLADVDTFLLKEADQKTDKSTMFTVSEIREQLENSGAKLLSVLKKSNLAINKPIPINTFIEN